MTMSDYIFKKLLNEAIEESNMAKRKLCLSDVAKKDIKIIFYLVASWFIGFVAVKITDDPNLIGLVPVANYLIYRAEKEAKKEGYVQVIKNGK